MKNHYLSIAFALFVLSASLCQAQTIIPDEGFKEYLKEYKLLLEDGTLNNQLAEQQDVIHINTNLEIIDISGIEAFKNLESLIIVGNKMVKIDISKNVKLTSVNFRNNQISSVNLGNQSQLQYLVLENNKLEDINLSNCPNLDVLNISNNPIKELNVSNNYLLKGLNVTNTPIKSLDVSNAPLLNTLIVSNTLLDQIDISKNINLVEFHSRNTFLTALDVTNNTKLIRIDVYKNAITELDVSQNLELRYLNLVYNQIKTIDVSNNRQLLSLFVRYNQLSYLDLRKNSISDFTGDPGRPAEGLDCVGNPDLRTICIHPRDKSKIEVWYYDKDITTFYSDGTCPIVSSSDDAAEALRTLVLYPQPATQELYVQYHQPIQHFRVYNSTGMQVLELANMYNNSVPVSQLPQGLYLLEVRLENGKHIVKNWVKE